MRRLRILAGLTAVHFSVSMVLIICSFVSGPGDEPPQVTVGVHLCQAVANVVLAPLFLAAVYLLPGRWFSGWPVDHLLLLANSFLWALGLWWAAGKLRERREKKKALGGISP